MSSFSITHQIIFSKINVIIKIVLFFSYFQTNFSALWNIQTMCNYVFLTFEIFVFWNNKVRNNFLILLITHWSVRLFLQSFDDFSSFLIKKHLTFQTLLNIWKEKLIFVFCSCRKTDIMMIWLYKHQLKQFIYLYLTVVKIPF